MGRGRQKAKATKVARKLKYFSPETDYAALERELVSASSGADPRDEYEELAAKYNVDDDDDWEDSDVPRSRGVEVDRPRSRSGLRARTDPGLQRLSRRVRPTTTS